MGKAKKAAAAVAATETPAVAQPEGLQALQGRIIEFDKGQVGKPPKDITHTAPPRTERPPPVARTPAAPPAVTAPSERQMSVHDRVVALEAKTALLHEVVESMGKDMHVAGSTVEISQRLARLEQPVATFSQRSLVGAVRNGHAVGLGVGVVVGAGGYQGVARGLNWLVQAARVPVGVVPTLVATGVGAVAGVVAGHVASR